MQAQRQVRTATLAAQFHVTPQTIRADLAILAQRGCLRPVHGGAMATPIIDTAAAGPPAVTLREVLHVLDAVHAAEHLLRHLAVELGQPPAHGPDSAATTDS